MGTRNFVQRLHKMGLRSTTNQFIHLSVVMHRTDIHFLKILNNQTRKPSRRDQSSPSLSTFRSKGMPVFLARWTPLASIPSEKVSKPQNDYKLQSRSHVLLPSQETSSHRRHVLVFTSVSLIPNLTFNFLPLPLFAWAEEKAKGEDDKDEGVIEAVKSLFDPNEKTKSGKVLPKAYLKSARELVRTLRDSLKEDPKDVAKFRRTADTAKESIREYLSGWRGQNTVVTEESYVVLEKAIRSLASFYSKAGPSAPLPEEVKLEILTDLQKAEDCL